MRYSSGKTTYGGLKLNSDRAADEKIKGTIQVRPKFLPCGRYQGLSGRKGDV